MGLAALVPFARAALMPGALAGLWPWAAYPLTGVAAWLVWERVELGLERKRAALRWWGWQLLLCGLWPGLLRGGGGAIPAIAPLALLAVALGLAVFSFARLRPWAAALLLLPYAVVAWAAVASGAARFGFAGA